MPDTKVKKLKFVHNWPSDYRIYPVNGAWGGVSGRGDMIIHFFVERHVVPKEEIQEVREDGTVGPVEKVPKEEQEIARDMQIGILMNREQAIGIANWIVKKVEEYENAIKKVSKE